MGFPLWFVFVSFDLFLLVFCLFWFVCVCVCVVVCMFFNFVLKDVIVHTQFVGTRYLG